MNSVAGSLGPAPIWREMMNNSLAGTANEKFSQPDGLIAQAICRNNGALAETGGSNTFTEYFVQGTLPSKKCNEKPKEQPKKTEEEPEQTPQPTQQEPEETTPTTPNNQNGTGGTGTGNSGTGTGGNNGSGTGNTGTGTGGTGTGGNNSGGTNQPRNP